MSAPVTINGRRVKTEQAEPPLRFPASPRFYATLEGEDDIVGNGTSRKAAIENLRQQLEIETETELNGALSLQPGEEL